MSTVKSDSEKFGLHMNIPKPKHVLLSKQKDVTPFSVIIDNQRVEQVDCFQYLGALVTEDGKCEREV